MVRMSAALFFMFVTTVSATSFAVREMPVKTSIRWLCKARSRSGGSTIGVTL